MIKKLKLLIFHHALRHPRLYSVVRWAKYLYWRTRVTIWNKAASGKYDPDELLQVSPASISLYIGGNIGNRFSTRGKIRSGKWDLDASPFDGWDISKSIRQHFTEGLSWEDTEYYKRNIREIEAGQVIRGARSAEQFKNNLSKLDELYLDIRDSGYASQRDLDERRASIGWEPVTKFSKFDDVTVAINRNGQFMLQDGKHRLAIAKALNVERIPVAVGLRHAKWEKFKLELIDYARDRGGCSYQPFTHPDLQDIPVQHCSPRETIIRNHMPVGTRTILDIGAYLGYFDLYFSALGYECTAVEHHPRHLYFMKKLMKSENLNFQIIDTSFQNWHDRKVFDVVLALNILHHFLKTEKLVKEMEKSLKSIETKCIFLETHGPDDEIMQGAFKNFPPAEFAMYISGASGLSNVNEIGTTTRGRRIFKISKDEPL